MTYFAYSYFEKRGHPKMYDRACRLMAAAHRSLYSWESLNALADQVDEALAGALPDGHAAHLVRTLMPKKNLACIHIATGQADDEVARLYLAAVRHTVGVELVEP